MDDDNLIIASAENDVLIGESGRRYLDLSCGFGTVFLGHCNPRITAAVRLQLERVWATGRGETGAGRDARRELERRLPDSHAVPSLYSTGMEAAEFALRFAREATGRTEVIGFEQNMHGKSLGTAALGWQNKLLTLPHTRLLPFPPQATEADLLRLLDDALAGGDVAAVFLEVLHGSGGAHRVSDDFCRELLGCCHRHGALAVFDEILCGFYRTGRLFSFDPEGAFPDVLLLGKAIANGFPVSAVVLPCDRPVTPAMLPGSTYSDNPLAAAAVAATLEAMAEIDMVANVSAIEAVIRRELVGEFPGAMRGAGALWVLELPDGSTAARFVDEARRAGVVVSYGGRFVRLLPPATASLDNLSRACGILAEVALSVFGPSTRSAG